MKIPLKRPYDAVRFHPARFTVVVIPPTSQSKLTTISLTTTQQPVIWEITSTRGCQFLFLYVIYLCVEIRKILRSHNKPVTCAYLHPIHRPQEAEKQKQEKTVTQETT